jgi:Outer membrane protein beta-barrel domain
MKKTIILAIVAMATQLATAQVRVGVQAGASLIDPTVGLSTTNATTKICGIKFIQPGLIFDIPMLSFLSFRPSINYLRSGYTQNIDSSAIIGSVSTAISSITTNTINNIYIPLDLTVPFKAGKGKAFVSAGPTIVIGLGGTSNTTNSVAGTPITPVNQQIKFGSAVGELKQINWGTSFGAGYNWRNGVELKANYNIGITDINNVSTADYRNSVISIMLGYYFIGKMK